ncbi:hypothetical protein [Halogeometricum pallidum]|uniref:hypothetical protein n=1 Tax=Halogeometricum pallidum TaxID=411361 RepID=UPI000677A8B9|nr:hypothetical protein [Halogeometricum pallidum]
MDDTSKSERTVLCGIRAGILAAFVAGIRRRNPGAVVNGVAAFALTYLPRLLERRFDVDLRGWQRTYLSVAMLAHAVGMLGLYDDDDRWWWWDHLTHTLSSTVLGGIAYVVADRRGRDPRRTVAVALIGGGVVWEVLEYGVHALTDRLGVDPVLVPYSARDTALDLLFNLVGGAVVVAFGDRLLENLLGDD